MLTLWFIWMGLLFTIPAGFAVVESRCVEQEEAYLNCVAKTQTRAFCEEEEISWYCRSEKLKDKRPDPEDGKEK